MNILVTGASGLIGGRFLSALLGKEAVTLRAASRVVRRWPAGIEGVVIDWGSPETLLWACDGMDAVLNLASMSEAACAADPEGALCANAGGTLSLVNRAMQAGVGRFVQLSTTKVYGNDAAGVITEETITRPTSHYAITHRAAEDYATQHGNAVVLRLANGFGAPVNLDTPCWNIIVNDFCRQAVSTGCIVIRSDGLTWRNFIPIDDVTVALRAAVAEIQRGTYNVGAAGSMTLKAMAERIAAVGAEVFGMRVDVSTGEPSAVATHEAATYSIARLRDAGVLLEGLVDAEIKRTLIAARQLFGRAANS